jgi:hypothetical protein
MPYKCDIFDDLQVWHLWWLTSVSSLMTYSVYAWIYIYIYIYIYIQQVRLLWWLTVLISPWNGSCIHLRIYDSCTYLCACMRICMYARIYHIYIYIHMCVCVGLHIMKSDHMHAHIHTCSHYIFVMHAHAHVCNSRVRAKQQLNFPARCEGNAPLPATMCTNIKITY